VTKTVQVLGHEFDGCAAHVTVAGKGVGHTLRVATQRAIENMFRDPRLRHKQIGTFKLSVVVIAERKAEPGPLADLKRRGFDPDVSIVPPPSAAADDALGTPQSVIDARPRGNCGECLIEHAAIVPLRNDGTCPCCLQNHAVGGAA